MTINPNGTDVPVIAADELPEEIRWFREHKKSLFIWGLPGIGKSQIIEQVAREIAQEEGLTFHMIGNDLDGVKVEDTFGFMDLRLSPMDSLDLKGGCLIDEAQDITRFLKPSMLPDVKRHGVKGFLLLDEFADAFGMTIAGITQLIWDGKIGDNYRLPPGWSIIAASNPPKSGFSSKETPGQANGRFGHFELVPTTEGFVAYANKVGVHPVITSYIRSRGVDMLHNYTKNAKAYPAPRSYMNADLAIKSTTDHKVLRRRMASFVGEICANELMAHITLISSGALPTWADVRDNPSTAPVADDFSSQKAAINFATVSMIVKSITDVSDMANVMAYVRRLDANFQQAFMIDVQGRKDAKVLFNCSAVSQWLVDNPHAAITIK